MDEPYVYHAKLIEILSLTGVGKKGVNNNEAKLRNFLSINYIFDLLNKE